MAMGIAGKEGGTTCKGWGLEKGGGAWSGRRGGARTGAFCGSVTACADAGGDDITTGGDVADGAVLGSAGFFGAARLGAAAGVEGDAGNAEGSEVGTSAAARRGQ